MFLCLSSPECSVAHHHQTWVMWSWDWTLGSAHDSQSLYPKELHHQAVSSPHPLVQPLVQGTYECGSKIKLTLVKHSEFFFWGGIHIIIVNILSHHLVVWSSKVDCVGNVGMLKGWTFLCCRCIMMCLSCCWRSVEFGRQSPVLYHRLQFLQGQRFFMLSIGRGYICLHRTSFVLFEFCQVKVKGLYVV